jgi:hypothetical protein
MISNDDESKAHDDIINSLSHAQSEIDALIAVEEAKTVIYYTTVQKGQDDICEDLDFCVESENDDDVFGIECDEHGVIKLASDCELAIGGSEQCIHDCLDPDSEHYEDGRPEWASHTRYECV